MSVLDNSYIIESGKINNYLHLVDINQFKRKRIFTAFIGEFDNSTVILDCGTSFDVNQLLRYMRNNGISLSSVQYLIPTHHHFDHTGGLWKLYEKVRVENPEVKILCTQKFKTLINNFETVPHYTYAKKSFGGLIGELKPIDNKAFEIINKGTIVKNNRTLYDVDITLKLGNQKVKLSILETPGHAPDHASPMFFINTQLDFIYFGDTLGIKSHQYKPITVPSCSAPNFNYKDYMASLDTLSSFNPQNAGFSHAGYVKGNHVVNGMMKEHKTLMIKFREMVIKYYSEKSETKYIFEKIWPWLTTKTDVSEGYTDNIILQKLILSMLYGMMMDLGYRQ